MGVLWFCKSCRWDFFLETVGKMVQGEDVRTFSKDTFEFAKVRIIDGDKGARGGVFDGL